jgi:4-cresol dehydrogenase (hydroxylating)
MMNSEFDFELSEALREWAAVVGREHVTADAASLRAAETGTFATRHRVPAIVRPASREQLQDCLRIANRFRIPVYPVSSGKNWGYGSRVPTADNSVLLDLGRMNRILDFSEELAYVTVEPGVTQEQLFAFLRERGSKLWMDATGASPQTSLIGNAVERGFGHTPYGDHFANSCALEVTLPTGEIIETGFARYASAVAAPVYRWGVGPSIDGLFSQSNFGIVTRMTIWLMPQPEYFQAYAFQCEKAEGLADVIDALRPLRLDGTIRSASHIGNDYKVISALRQYPWQETGGETPLRGAALEDLRRRMQVGAWSGFGALYGSRGQVKEARRLLRKALAGKVSKLQFLDDRMLAFAERFAKPIQWITGMNVARTLEVVKPVYGLMRGVPTDHPLASTYWRKRTPPPAKMDPDRDGCGLLWCSPVVPCDGPQASRVTALATDLALEHGLEPAISLTMITDRSLACIISLAYDRSVPGEDERAAACYHALLGRLAAEGYHSYRFSVLSMAAMHGAPAYTDFLRQVKQAVDPNGILAPGRYLAAESPASADVLNHAGLAAGAR